MSNQNVKVLSIENLIREIQKAQEKKREREEQDDCDCATCELSELCSNSSENKEEKTPEISFLDFLKGISEEINDTDEELFTLAEIIEMYEEGYEGTFSDHEAEYTYDLNSKTPLVVTSVGTFPACITSSFTHDKRFSIEEKIIPNGEALERIRQGERLRFKIDLIDDEIYGDLRMVDGKATLTVKNPEVISEELETRQIISQDLMLEALIEGTWYK